MSRRKMNTDKLQFLRDAVAAKMRYWDAVSSLEKSLLNGNDPTDSQSDKITQMVENLAAGLDDSENVSESVDTEMLETLVAELV